MNFMPPPAETASVANTGARRSLLLNAAGAMLGLLLAGYALFTAQGTAIGGLPPEDVALVNGRPILQSDFVTQTQIETGAPFKESSAADRKRVLQEMIQEELLVQRGLEVDLAASDPDVRSALVAGVNLQVDAEILAAQPTDAELHSYYAAHRDRYAIDGTMDLRDFVLPLQPSADPRAAAAALATALHDAATLQQVATALGLADTHRIGTGPNFDFGVKAKLGETLFRAAITLGAGQVSPPITDGGTTHILVMLARVPGRQLAFAAARDQIWQDLQREARAHVENANLAFLRSRADILVAPELAP
jgi:parvulin-like peptidyl-prolyl isomerase